jgi:hypothetical protein
MANMPTGSYVGLSSAINDVDGYDVYDIPREFKNESATGFLVCRITFRQTATAITVHNTTDLRGRTPGTASGTAITGGTEFADNQFKIFAVGDNTKIVDLDLVGITTGNTRTIEIPNYDMIIPGGTVAASTDLYYAGGKRLQTTPNGAYILNGSYFFDFYLDATDSYIVNKSPGTNFKLMLFDSDSNQHAVLTGVPDGAVELYYGGVKKFETHDGGVHIYGDSATTSVLNFLGSGGVLLGRWAAGSSALTLQVGTSFENGIIVWENGAVDLHYNNIKTVSTTATGLDTLFANEWTKQQGFNEDTITSSSNAVAWNLTTDQCTLHTLTEHTTISEPTNMQAGSTYHLRVVQAAGVYTLAWNAVFKWGVPGVPAAPAADGDYVVFSFYCDGTNMIGAEFNRTEA